MFLTYKKKLFWVNFSMDPYLYIILIIRLFKYQQRHMCQRVFLFFSEYYTSDANIQMVSNKGKLNARVQFGGFYGDEWRHLFTVARWAAVECLLWSNFRNGSRSALLSSKLELFYIGVAELYFIYLTIKIEESSLEWRHLSNIWELLISPMFPVSS